MTKKIVVFFLALASFISVDAQNEVLGAYVKKGGTESGINATSRFPMYSVMKFPQALYVADFLRPLFSFRSLSLHPRWNDKALRCSACLSTN